MTLHYITVKSLVIESKQTDLQVQKTGGQPIFTLDWFSAFTGIVLVLFLSSLAFSQVPSSQHVILVIEENRSYSTVTNSGNSSNYMPWLVNEGNMYGHATNYTSDTQGSAMDYFWLSSGSCHSSPNCVFPSGTHDFGCGGMVALPAAAL